MSVLVTGGAGYIGSHVVRALLEKGEDVIVLDNLSTGHAEFVPKDILVVGDAGDEEKVSSLIRERRVESVMHFAAFIVVPESVENPEKYYSNNLAKSLSLIRACVGNGVKHFIFSSTAAVYGEPLNVPIKESEKVAPINPYGRTKAAIEWILRDFSEAYGFSHVSLRYFNAAGAHPGGGIGETHDPETHLIPLVLKAVKGERKTVKIFGTDYPTPDGTCIRDYVHVCDLADAHILALDYLRDGGKSEAFNCGYGHGYSVREVIQAARKVTGIDFPVEEAERRPGDPPVLVADSTKLRKTLNWVPKYDDLRFIIRAAWEFERGR